MTIKHQGGIFGRNPTFNNVDVDGVLTVDQIAEKTAAAGITLDGVTLKDGNVVLADGNGIDFSATSGTGTSELFDDYEEGTWSPAVADALAGGNAATLSVQTGITQRSETLFTSKLRLLLAAKVVCLLVIPFISVDFRFLQLIAQMEPQRFRSFAMVQPSQTM
jgi:hypothetical protein